MIVSVTHTFGRFAVALINTYDGRLLLSETTVGAGAQILLLAFLGTAIGLGPAGWLTGLAFAARHLGRPRPRPAAHPDPHLRPRQPRHPRPGDPGRRGDRPGRRLLRELAAGLAVRRPDGRGADPRRRRRPGRPPHGHLDRAGRPLRHGGRRVPDPGAQRVRLHVAGPVGAADRRHAVRLRRRGPGHAVAERLRSRTAWPARRSPRSRASSCWSPPPACCRTRCGFALVALALGSLVWSFGRDIAWLFLNREGRDEPTTATATVTETVTVTVVAPAERRTAELVTS